MYPVQFDIDEGNFAIRLAEVRDWLRQHRIDPARLHYRMGPDHVRLRIEFAKSHDADAFRTQFKLYLRPSAA